MRNKLSEFMGEKRIIEEFVKGAVKRGSKKKSIENFTYEIISRMASEISSGLASRFSSGKKFNTVIPINNRMCEDIVWMVSDCIVSYAFSDESLEEMTISMHRRTYDILNSFFGGGYSKWYRSYIEVVEETLDSVAVMYTISRWTASFDKYNSIMVLAEYLKALEMFTKEEHFEGVGDLLIRSIVHIEEDLSEHLKRFDKEEHDDNIWIYKNLSYYLWLLNLLDLKGRYLAGISKDDSLESAFGKIKERFDLEGDIFRECTISYLAVGKVVGDILKDPTKDIGVASLSVIYAKACLEAHTRMINISFAGYGVLGDLKESRGEIEEGRYENKRILKEMRAAKKDIERMDRDICRLREERDVNRETIKKLTEDMKRMKSWEEVVSLREEVDKLNKCIESMSKKHESSYSFVSKKVEDLTKENNRLEEDNKEMHKKLLEMDEIKKALMESYQDTEKDLAGGELEENEMRTLKSTKMLMFGGLKQLTVKLKDEIPMMRVYDESNWWSWEPETLESVGMVIFYTPILAHSIFYKVIGEVRRKKIPYMYVNSSNVGIIKKSISDKIASLGEIN